MHHICHISTTFNSKSGSARRTSAILAECVRVGYRVSVIFGRDHDVKPSDLPGVSTFCVPELVKYVTPRLDIAAPWKIAEILQRIKPDIVHTHLAKAGIVGRIAARRAGTSSVLHTVHGPTFHQGMGRIRKSIYWGLEKICGKLTDQFVFVGEELRQNYIDAGICEGENSHVIRTGRPEEVIDRQPLHDSVRMALRHEFSCYTDADFLIVLVGRIVPAKQLDHAVRILRDIRDRGVAARLAVVGKSLLAEEKGYEQKIRQLAREQGIEGYVYFTGFRQDVLAIMDAADAVLLTSRYEGLPNVAVEALIANTPLVAYDVSGVQEVVHHELTGYIVAQGDISKAVDLLCAISQGNVLSDIEAADERKTFLDSFREQRMLQDKMNLYEQVLHTVKKACER